MKKHLLSSLLILISCCCGIITVSGQNLVLNPSFENTSSCPTGISEFYLATNWSSTNTGADTCSSPDLYATCANTFGGVNVPNCLLGYQQPRTGTHFAGIILGDGIPGCIPTGDNYREYVEGTLSSALTAGQKYKVVFYVNLAEQSMWGSNSFGVYFTNTQYLHNACPNSPLINQTPQLVMCGPAIMDTVNWVPITWIYTATGGEQYFTIGNFNNDNNTNRVSHDCGSFNPYIYYYIEDASISTAGPNDCSFSVLTDSVNATCGGHNGSVAVKAFGCTSPFTYLWSSGATSANVASLASGTYTVTVTDVSNCQTTASTHINSTPMAVNLTATNPTCGGSTGSATIAITIGTGPYTYSWNNGATTASITGLSSGNYRVTVAGATGCSAIDSISLLGSSGFTVNPTTVAAACGNSNGSATAVITGGTGPFTYNWSNGQTTQTATGLAAGTYTVTISGDTTSAPFFTEDFTSGGTNWTLNTVGNGADGNSANQWVVGNDTSCACGSGKHLYIEPTNSTSCFICIPQRGTCTYMELASTFGEGNFATDVLAISPSVSTLGKSNITLSFSWECLGTPGSDYGWIDLSGDGGATWTALSTQYVNTSTCTQATVSIPINYQNIANFKFAFEWVNGAGSLGNAGNPPGFVIDNISLTAASSNCPSVTTVTVPVSTGITASITPTSPTCGQNGSATAVPGGTGPFTYTWNNGATTASISNLGAGIYVVTVSNTTGCTATATTSLGVGSGSINAAVSGTDASCGNNNGTVTTNISPANVNYTYSWSNGATTANINNLSANTYSVTVTGAGGCTATATTTIAGTPGMTISTSGTRAGCVSSGIGSVTVNTGTGPFTYLWSNGATTANLTNLSAGNYTVTVTGSGGCSVSGSMTVNSTGTGVTVNATANPTGCSGNTGSVILNISTGNGPFTYLWSNSATTDSLSNIASGSYTVTVTSSDGCSATAVAVVSLSGTLAATTSAVGTTCGNANGSATVTVSGGPYTYIWSNGATTASISNVAGGTYTVTVQGGSGCSATASVSVNTSGSTITIQPSATTICQGDTSHICAPAGFLSYLWSNGQTSQCISATATGNYYVTVTDNGSCTATSNHVTITVNTAATVTITQHGDTLKASSATSYQWYLGNTAISGATSSIYIATQDGSYTVKGTDSHGCTATSNSEVVKVVLAVSQISQDANIKVYPNPLSNGSWHIEVGEEWIGSDCEIVDAAGRVIYHTQLKNMQSEIDLNVAEGIYLMRIHTGQKNYTIKLIKL